MAPYSSRTATRRKSFRVSAPALAVALVLIAVAAAPASTQEDSKKQRPLRFDSEIVRIFVQEDSVEVQSLYRFVCRPSKASKTDLLYPYPADTLLGGARAVSFEYRIPRGKWYPLDYKDIPRRRVARWTLPPCPKEGLEVRVVYRQALLAHYVRYIVTSTQGWGHPLSHAVFEVHLPEGAENIDFNYPFEERTSKGKTFHVYETTDFMPDHDIIVSWHGESRK